MTGSGLWKQLFIWCVFPVVSVCVFGMGVQSGRGFLVDVLEEGLPQRSVISIYQTKNGYLWFGTLNGLVRFDGIRMEVFYDSDFPVLMDPRVIRIFEDSRTNLWLASDAGRVVCIKSDRGFGFDLGSSGERVAAFAEACRTQVWIYTTAGQLFRVLETNVDVWKFGAQYSSAYRGLLVEGDSLLWIGVDWGLYGFDVSGAPSDREIGRLQFVIPTSKLDYLVPSKRGGYWRLADGRIQRWITNSLVKDYGPYPWRVHARVSVAIEDDSGGLVVGTINENDGVYWMRSDGSWVHITSKDGLSHDGVLSLWFDREGNLWVGTDGGGVNRVRTRLFSPVPESRGWVVQSVAVDSQGGVWIGFGGGGVLYWNGPTTKEYGPAQGLWDKGVRAVLVDKMGTVWVGTWNGLFRLQGDRFQFVRLPEVQFVPVHCLYESEDGVLWVGTEIGLFQKRGEEWQRVHVPGLPGGPVKSVGMDASGQLWVGLSGFGVARVKANTLTGLWTATNGLPSAFINALLVESTNRIWVGTPSGLGLIRNDEAISLPRQVLPGWFRGVNYLLMDGFGWLWLGTSQGLIRANPDELTAAFESGQMSVTARRYTQADGLPTSECTGGSQPAAAVMPDGRLLFSTIKGLAAVDPRDIRSNTNPPPVLITSVRLDGVGLITNSVNLVPPPLVRVPPSTERLEIEFVSPSYSRPECVRYRYRLEGHEDNWVETSAERLARYTRLAPGRYEFVVTACNEDGIWNLLGARLWVVVEPPFWRRWWFLTGCAIVAAGGFAGVIYLVSSYKYRRRLMALEQQRALDRERSRIARDLHDQLGADLAQIALLAEVISSGVDSREELEAHAKTIMASARQTVEALDEIVWATNPAHDTLESLVAYVSKCFEEYLRGVGIRVRISVPTEVPHVYLAPDLRHNVYMAVKEAIANIVKHSGAKEAELWVCVRQGLVTIELRDDGRGFDAARELAIGCDGLRNMQRRLSSVGGECRIESEPGRGTTVIIRFPVASGGIR